jgi:hypothetical protein
MGEGMTSEELARAAALNIVKIMAIKWTIIIGLNKWAKHVAKKNGWQ